MSRTYFGAPPSSEAVALQDTYLDLRYMAVETEHLRWVLRPRESSLGIGRPRGTCCRMEALVRRHRAATDRARRCTRRPRRHHLQIPVPQPASPGWREPQAVLTGLRQELRMRADWCRESSRSVSNVATLPPRVAGCSSGSRTRSPPRRPRSPTPALTSRSENLEVVRASDSRLLTPTRSRTISTRRCRRPSMTKRDADTMATSFTLEPRSAVSSRFDGMGIASPTQQHRRPIRRRHLPARAEIDRRGRRHRSPPAWATRGTSTRCFRGDRPTQA